MCNAQHPAQRCENPLRLRHVAHQCHHLWIRQKIRQLRATSRCLIPHQMNQPSKSPGQHKINRLRSPRQTALRQNRRGPAPSSPLPPRANPLHQRQKPGLRLCHPPMHGHHQILRQRGRPATAAQTLAHRPAYPRGDMPKLARIAGEEGIFHEPNKKTQRPADCNTEKPKPRTINAPVTSSPIPWPLSSKESQLVLAQATPITATTALCITVRAAGLKSFPSSCVHLSIRYCADSFRTVRPLCPTTSCH